MKILKIMCILALGASAALAGGYCQMCGMDLDENKASNHRLIDEDSNATNACSLHCAYDKSKDSNMKNTLIEGLSNDTNAFKPINKLFYVIGSDKKTAMTSESEIAFSDYNKALEFSKKHGGRIISGDEMLKYEEGKFDKDLARISKNRAKIKEMGEKIAKEYCDVGLIKKIEAKDIADFKIKAKNHCKNIDGKGLQAVAIYFWQDKF